MANGLFKTRSTRRRLLRLSPNEVEVNSYLKGGGAVKKQATRGKQHIEPFVPLRPHSGRKSSTRKKIKKIIKAMKEMMGEITNLVELMIQFSKDILAKRQVTRGILPKQNNFFR
ncbi:hypothetical protein PIB30_086279 [Stylosanthes scabra]|uniref:Uncharacterized protein n=1 Tax=Stylosanthes scabra TaxID=79078 RepID=A0ABU6VTE7_9FABA|nr:hypothetical protein [Stylosanthes scabra]